MVLLDTRFVVVVARVAAMFFLFVVIGRPFASSCFSMFLVAPGLDCTGKGGGAKLVFGGGTAFWGIAGVIVWASTVVVYSLLLVAAVAKMVRPHWTCLCCL